MRFTPQLLDEIRARLSVSQVVARKVALKKKGREYSGLSPFKSEKTPSFFVNDQKGFYHCFATGEHGDIFTFLIKTEGLSFPEAVERLAAEAGVAMPAKEERNPEREDQRTRLYALLEAAAAFFQASLKGGAGAEARRYIENRGLSRETIARFRLGYAPNGRSALKEYLAEQGFSAQDMIASGMLIAGDDIPVPYDRFRNRVIFPILDLKGRVIAFGGRALDPDAPAKYLNSPETPLFHKGAILFNAAAARAAAHDRDRVIVVEGYMDVVALVQAGFAEAVAPLGTALTEDQIKLLWRMAPEPTLCFDGDSAGRKAAYRAIDTALPHLKPGQSVKFAFLPDGLDPDDMIRVQGAAALNDVLQKTRGLFEVLWEREEGQQPLSSPENRAAFETRVKGLVQRIGDPTVRAHYESEVRETLWRWNRTVLRERAAAKGGHRPAGGGSGRGGAPADWRVRERVRMRLPPGLAGTAAQASSGLIAARSAPFPLREALLLKVLINHPWLIEEHAESIAELMLTSPALQRLRDGLLTLQAGNISLDRATLRSQLEPLSLDKVLDLAERAITHKSDRFAEPDAERAEVEVGWRHTLALHERQIGLRKALEAAERAWHDEGSEDALARICEIQGLIASSDVVEASTDG